MLSSSPGGILLYFSPSVWKSLHTTWCNVHSYLWGPCVRTETEEFDKCYQTVFPVPRFACAYPPITLSFPLLLNRPEIQRLDSEGVNSQLPLPSGIWIIGDSRPERIWFCLPAHPPAPSHVRKVLGCTDSTARRSFPCNLKSLSK